MVIGRKLFHLLLFICLLILPSGKCLRSADLKEGTNASDTVEDLVRKWSPLVWLAPQEKYFPLSAEKYLRNVYVSDENGKMVAPHLDGKTSKYRSKSFNLMTYRSTDSLQNDTTSFIYGNSNLNEVSIYAVVTHCSTSTNGIENEIQENGNHLYFHVGYWIFYPFNLGKDLCVIGRVPALKIFSRCFGKLKTIGNHIGDWEHVSLSFVGKNVPDKLYLAVHTTGAFYTFNEENHFFKLDPINKAGALPKYPEIIRTQGEHPIVFSAYGSHGMWATPGEQQYFKVPKLIDRTGYGTPWKTWNNIKIFHIGHGNLPYWLNFRGRWGNPKKKCLLFKKLGICEFSDGPTGILRKKAEFYCFFNG